MSHWIWSNTDWPHFTWDIQQLTPHLASARLVQGKLLGVIETIGIELSEQADALVLAEQAIDTSAIEGEHLNRDSVRSSIANRLGLEKAGMSGQPDRHVEGLLDMLLDATQSYEKSLTLERLCGWQAALFPTGYSGIQKVKVGALRDPGPMQIVSGRLDKPKVYYEAPPADHIQADIEQFLSWFNESQEIDGVLKAGIAHVWFELLHPFEDGNGRVGRAVIDLALAQDEALNTRYYSISSAIMKDRKSYYAILEKTCQGGMDVTEWLIWFLGCFKEALKASIQLITDIGFKSRFWKKHAETILNARQVKVLNRLLDAGKGGFEGGMTTRKYQQLTKASRATAYRELIDLVDKRCLITMSKKGRSAAYEIASVMHF